MADTRIETMVIVGGGTAGWMAAAALANRLKKSSIRITLVDSPDIGTIGVGEATVPYLKEFLEDLGIDEVDFVRKTEATYKLGIDFDGWYKPGQRFFHPFSDYGASIARIPFHHYWAKMKNIGGAGSLDEYCLASQIAYANKFAIPNKNQINDVTNFNYAFHFDAALFANYLKAYALKLGVNHQQGLINAVQTSNDDGFIQSIQLDSGQIIEGDFFIDCSGFKGILIEQTLATGYEDWTRWLPCDRAVAIPCASTTEPTPYTRSLAMDAGWQWRIPLQHRTGNGYVYSSKHLSDDAAASKMLANLEGAALMQPKFLRFQTGVRKKVWNKNVYALGLSSGFMEPLESTSIYLVQHGINSLLNNFPSKIYNPVLIDEVNRYFLAHQERLRDFLILHYYANQRHGEDFWDDCRNMSIPDSLSYRINLFKHSCRLAIDSYDFFKTSSWLAMFSGFNIVPENYHPAVDDFDEHLIKSELKVIAEGINTAIKNLPGHQEFLKKNIPR